MKNLFLILTFCVLMTESQGAEVSTSDLNVEDKPKTVEFWYIDVGPKEL